MRNPILLLSLVISIFFSCSKDGETGPQGPAGTNGTNGNANVHSYLIANPTVAEWILNSSINSYYYDFSIPQITNDIIRNGTVNVFLGSLIAGTNDSSLTPLPYTLFTNTYTVCWTCSISPGKVLLHYKHDPITTPNPGFYFGDAFFKFVVIEGQ